MNPRRLQLIACRVFERELEVLAATARVALRIQYLEMALHEKSGAQLRAALQQAVDAVSREQSDAIGLGYGLCNRGLVGLQARHLPIVIPRAHDCLGILLGSTDRYLAELEREAGTYFQSAGWIEHLPPDRSLRPLAAGTGGMQSTPEALVARYGAENAQYLLEEIAKLTRHYRRLAFISTPVSGVKERSKTATNLAAQRGWRFEQLEGDLGWLRRLVNGDWEEREFLILNPGERVELRYDGKIIGAQQP